MSLFHKIHLPKIDPLGGGLDEEIAAERQESNSITLDETINGQELALAWQEISTDARNDPEYFFDET